MKLAILLNLLLLVTAAQAQESAQADYCQDATINNDWRKHIAAYSKDPIILKLAGLREGLCLMIERGQITQEQGINIWEDERQRSLVDRNKEQALQMPNYTL